MYETTTNQLSNMKRKHVIKWILFLVVLTVNVSTGIKVTLGGTDVLANKPDEITCWSQLKFNLMYSTTRCSTCESVSFYRGDAGESTCTVG